VGYIACNGKSTDTNTLEELSLIGAAGNVSENKYLRIAE